MAVVSFQSSLAIAATLSLAYFLSTTIYRLFFHPLSRFPGPKLAAITYLYEAYFDLWKAPGGQFIYHLDALHDKYGPIIRCSPDEIHVRDSSWYDTLYAAGHRRDKWERSNRANNSKGSVASAVSHDLHRARRGALSPFFSKQSAHGLEASIREKTDKLCGKLSQSAKAGEIVDVGSACTAVTLDVITQYCFGQCQNVLDDPEYGRRWKEMFQGVFDGSIVGKHFPLIVRTLQSLPQNVAKSLNPDLGTFFEMQDLVHQKARAIYDQEEKAGMIRYQEGEQKPETIFHGILRSKLPRDAKTIERLCDEAFVVVGAGAETTARVISSTLAHLAEDKELYMRLRKEIDEICGSGSRIPESHKLEELPLMRAVAYEGIRVTVPVTNRVQLVAPDEDLRYGEWLIPRGTPTSMTHANVLLDEMIFPEPYAFLPERWMEKRADGERLDRFLVAFGKGGRNCIGQNIAWAEIYTMIAAVVSKFDLKLIDFDYERDLKTTRDCFVGFPSKESKGVRVKLTVRT